MDVVRGSRGVLLWLVVSFGLVAPATAITLEESVTGSSTDSMSVSTAGDVGASAGQLYLAAISAKKDRAVQQVTGLGLAWAPLAPQCGARSQTGIEVWSAIGDGQNPGPVSALLEGSPPANAAIVVSRYSGLDAGQPIGNVASANTLGVAGPCDGGFDTPVYSVDVETEVADALVYAAVAIRRRNHTPGAGFSETAEIHHGSDTVGIAVQQMEVPAQSIVGVTGSLNKKVDWAVVAIELRPSGTSGPTPDIQVTPTEHDFGDIESGGHAEVTFEVRNDGDLDLMISELAIEGVDAGSFDILAGGAPVVLLPQSSVDVIVSFDPLTTGTKSAILSIESDDPGDPSLAISLMGNVPAPATPDLAVNPTSHDFGSLSVGSLASASIELSNLGSLDLSLSALSLVGTNAEEFEIVAGGSPVIVVPGASQDVSLRFSPVSAGAKAAMLRIESDDPFEPVFDVLLSGAGFDPPPPGGDVAYRGSDVGESLGSTSVSTASDVPANPGELYLASISTKKFRRVVSLSGLGLSWQPLVTQCGGRSQTGVEVWYATGTPGSAGPVTAILDADPTAAVIAVSRYSGADSIWPIGATLGSNSNGPNGACSGGSDGTAYDFDLTTTVPGSRIYAAAALRKRSHEPGAGYLEQLEFTSSNSDRAGVAVQDRQVAVVGTTTVNGSFSRSVDWAVAAVELVPVLGPVADIAVAPRVADFGLLMPGQSSTRSFVIGNEGDDALEIEAIQLVTDDADEFALEDLGPPFTLQPSESVSLDVEFAPTSTGDKTTLLRIESNDPDENPVDVVLTGRAADSLDPDIGVQPAAHDFGDVVLGGSASKKIAVTNEGGQDLVVSSTTLTGSDAVDFDIADGGAPFTLSAGASREITVTFSPDTTDLSQANLEILSNDPDEAALLVPLDGAGVELSSTGSIWLSPSEIAALPMSGNAWQNMKSIADSSLGQADIALLHSVHDVRTLAVALVYARTGDDVYRQKAAAAILDAIGTEPGGTAHSLGRNLFCYIMAADLINLAEFNAAGDAGFRSWMAAARYVEYSDGTLVSEDEDRANNHGRFTGATRAAIAIYLDEPAEIETVAQILHGVLGNRDAYDGFRWTHDLSWQEDENNPVGINPVGATKSGVSIDGVLTEEMRRGCSFQDPPCYTPYPWEGLQGIVVEAWILSRKGYDVFNWENQALRRAGQYLQDLDSRFPSVGWTADGDDTFLPWILNHVYGTSFSTKETDFGELMSYTDWMFPDAGGN